MPDHVYSKHIKDKTLQGFVVNGLPFLTLFEAEAACSRFGFPPDKDHLFYAPAEARQLARQSLLEAEYTARLIKQFWEGTQSALNALAAYRDSLSSKSLFEQVKKELAQEKVIEQIGACHGAYICLESINARLSKLREIAALKG